jgi:hypothetical protein
MRIDQIGIALLASFHLLACAVDEPTVTDRTAAASTMLPLPTDYQSWAGCDKQAWLWDRIVETTYDELPSWNAVWWWPSGLFTQNNRVSIDHESDVMPPFRKRRIHTYGDVATVELVPVSGTPYGGMLGGGCALARISLAATPGLNPITPGLALKLFVDGERSVNVHAMPSLDGQGDDTNLFARTYSTVLAPPTRPALQPVLVLFAAASPHPLRIGLDRLATVRPDGGVDVAPIPTELRFLPTAAAQLPSSSPLDTRDLLAGIDPGTTLFAVYAVPAGGAAPVHVADLVTTSPFVASRFGDEALFFQHEEAH